MATPISKEQQKQLVEDGEKAILLKESLKIVDELGKLDIDEMGVSEEDAEQLEALASRAKKLTKNRLWKL